MSEQSFGKEAIAYWEDLEKRAEQRQAKQLPPLKCDACGERQSILDLCTDGKCMCGSDQVFVEASPLIGE